MGEQSTKKRPTFPKGNQLWKIRTTMGRKKLFADGNVLWEEAQQYFAWCDANPWMRPELVKHKGDAEQYDVPLGRPYTMDGLCVYLNVSQAYFRGAEKGLREKTELSKADEELLDTIERIRQVVRTQNFEGAILNVYNANFTARMHGIADNVNANNTGDAVLRITVRDPQTAENLNKLEDMLK